jgi:glycosyltransferase involved in cell wall biosynthesis
MVRVALLTPSFTSADAVSNDVVGMYDALQRRGYKTRIFAEGWESATAGIHPYKSVSNFLKSNDDVLIYHYSRGWDPGLQILHGSGSRTVVRYHNVTPPEFFIRYNPELAAMCRAGREQLTPIAQSNCDRYLSASSYNSDELIAAGAGASASYVVPPFHHIDRLRSVEPDQEILKRYGDGKLNVIMVGRVSPNKGHPALLEAFAAFHHDYNSDSRLIIVGKEETRLRNYGSMLRELVNRLKLKGAVKFTGAVSDVTLRAYYETAHAFMITSDHEGFCVPLVEAMSMGIPVFAYSSSAIPETIGDAGIVWTERDPYLLAEALSTVTSNKLMHQRLAAKGRRRYEQHFTNEKIEAAFYGAMSGML